MKSIFTYTMEGQWQKDTSQTYRILFSRMAAFMAAFLALTIHCGGDSKGSDGGTAGGDACAGNIPAGLRGQWFYVHNQELTWLGDCTRADLALPDGPLPETGLETVNLLAEEKQDTRYYLVRAGIPDVRVSGSIGNLNGGASAGKSRAGLDRGLAGVGSLQVVLENLADSSVRVETNTDENGNFNAEVPSGNYQVAAAREDEAVSGTVRVDGAESDLGQFTLVPEDLHNFKTTLLNQKPAYFGTDPATLKREYSLAFEFRNIGAADISGVVAEVTVDTNSQSLIRGYTASPKVLGGLGPGDADTLNATVSFHRPDQVTVVNFNIKITDYSGRIWYDRVSLNLESALPVEVELRGEVKGFLVGPGRTIVEDLTVPFRPGEDYELLLSTPDITGEAVYSLAVGADWEPSLTDFFELAKNEPDNSEDQATVMPLYGRTRGYLNKGDLDYFKIQFAASPAPLELIPGDFLNSTGGFRDVVFKDGYSYLAAFDSGLQIVDIQNPDNLSLTAEDSTATVASGVTLSADGNHAFVADKWNGVRVFNISNPASPSHLLAVDTPVSALDVERVGNYLYVADYDEIVQVIDVSNPGSSAITGSFTLPATASRIYQKDNYLLTTNGAINIYNPVSSPLNPPLVASLNFNGQGFFCNSPTSDLAAVVDGGQLNLYDLSQMEQPKLLATETGGISQTADCAFWGSYILTATFYPGEGISVFHYDGDGNGDYKVTFVKTITDLGAPRGIRILGDRLYSFVGTNRFQVSLLK